MTEKTGVSHGESSYTLDGLSVFFQSRRADVDADLPQRLAEFILATKDSLDCAIYDLRHPLILQALMQVAQQGKRLRIAFDGGKAHSGGLSADPKPDGTQQALENTGLIRYATPVHEHGRHLMHDKFLIRDGQALWTGSANFTVGGLELQDNNCLIIPSRELAASYEDAFMGLLDGATRRTLPLGQATTVGAITLMPFFAPAANERIEDSVIAAIKRARRLRVMAFLISDPGILSALAPFANDPQADIRGVIDPNGMDDVLRYTHQDPALFWFMKDPRVAQAPSHPYSPAHEQDFMHNKVIIVDDSLVITGSYNFSENAEANDENVLAIQSPALAAAYTAYFDRLYADYQGGHLTRLPEVAFVAGFPGATSGPVAQASQPEVYHMTFPQGSLPRPHVLKFPGRGAIPYDQITLPKSRASFGGEQQYAQTQYAIIYTDGSQQGNASAQAVQSNFDADYQVIQNYFGGIALPPGQQGDDQTTPRTALPIQILEDSQAGGAYHFGCNATDLYIEPTPNLAEGFAIAELVEVFESAINNGWQCGQTNGEALSRVLAADRSPALAQLQTPVGQQWWADGNADYVTNNNATDQDNDSNGCGPLFLYYLHSQLHFDWRTIVTAGGSSLGDTYQKLTGNSPQQGFQDFLSRLATIANGTTLNLPANGNPFPIGQTTTPPTPAPTNTGGSSNGGSSGGSGGAGVNWLVVGIIAVIIVLIVIGILLGTHTI